MGKVFVMPLLLATAFMLTCSPSRAYYDGAWCAVSSHGRGGAVERCEFKDFESCRLEVIAGDRGFCRLNGYAMQAAAPQRTRKRHPH